ncbi:MAG TPA: aminoacyl-tRNA hydrolase [Candidatus Limnocylindria bacterium]|nr:aminoacyl-tRNA hydrolase [Candidatus Limnocylindria bacterium]
MSEFWLIIGLGNPGREYRDTRHNAGFMLAESLAARWKCTWRTEAKFNAEIAAGEFGSRRILLAKPQTYMNASGEAARKLAHFYKTAAERVLVLVDDADLPLGTVRMRPGGSSGGHHGLDSMAEHLGTADFPRLKLGIARPHQGVRDIAGYVLSRFGAEDMPVWHKVLERSSLQTEMWLREGVAKAMSLYNGTV